MQITLIKNAKILAGSVLKPCPDSGTCDVLINGYYAAIQPQIDASDKNFACAIPYSAESAFFNFAMTDSIIEVDIQGRTLSPALVHFHIHPTFGTLARLEDIGERTDSETAILGYDLVKQYQKRGFIYQHSAASANRDSDAGIATYLQKQKTAGHVVPYFYPASEEITPVGNLGDVKSGKSFGRPITGPYEARLEARKAAGLGCSVKINLSNDHATGNANDTPTFYDEAEAAYKAARGLGKHVQVHARSNASVKMAVDLGVSVIHHAGGIAYDDDYIKELQERRARNRAKAEQAAQEALNKLFNNIPKHTIENASNRERIAQIHANEIASELISNQKQDIAEKIKTLIFAEDKKALQALLASYYQRPYYFVFVPTYGASNAFYHDAIKNAPNSETTFQLTVERERVICLVKKLLAAQLPVLEGGDNALQQHPPFSEFEDLWYTQQDMQLSWQEVYKMITINGLKAIEMLRGEEDIAEGITVGMRAHGVIIDGDLAATGMHLFKEKGKDAIVGVIQDGLFIRLARNTYPKGMQADGLTKGPYKKDLNKMLQKSNSKIVDAMPFFSRQQNLDADTFKPTGLSIGKDSA